ncbi:hypothetical protein [Ensifer sp. LCM 4579]|uniref:hypothetical protein n=1 Tax=Ensifer sp. LCM 4579 TaxID=1848292 RepID=UPI0009F47491|nr:hypothetical protein [Ensifer sp. LCM 4579]
MRQAYSPDDVDVMRGALDIWCALHNVGKDGAEANRAARRILDLMDQKKCSCDELLARMGDFMPAQHYRLS